MKLDETKLVAEDALYNAFKNPAIDYKSRPLWFWNGISDVSKMDKQWIKDTVNGSFASGYNGFGILPYGIGGYLSKDYFDMYRVVLDECKKNGMKLNLYDENGFPSGPAGDLFQNTYPLDTAKILIKNEINVKGPAKGTMSINLGTKDEPFMGAVAMNNDTKELIVLINEGDDVCYDLAEGDWKVMTFNVCRDGNSFCDYLDVQDVEKFIDLTHQAYYNEFPKYFGDVIDMTFYDEPAMWRGNTWTEKYNEKFEAVNGFSPVKYYPALWYDIGEDTAYARNKLFGFRADLFADGFIKTIGEWCATHKIKLTGHVGEEELVNPTSAAGDLMKVFRDQDIPGIDSVIFYGRISRALKVVSSSANNYDKQKVMTEIHGASDTLDVLTMYRDVMDQFAKGINLMVPHAVWYDPYGAGFMNPELSFRDPKWGRILPEYNNYIGRASSILQQEGQHVADIGVLYPIHSLQNGFRFDGGYEVYKGGVVPKAEWNYMDIGEMLSLDVRRDFTYLHPDVIDNKCTVDGKIFKLNNTINYEQYKTIIIPGADTISLSNLTKIKKFYDNGGLVIGSRQLPYMSSEKGKSNCVVKIIKEMFGVEPRTSTGPIYTASSQYEVSWMGDTIGLEPWKAGDDHQNSRWESVGFSDEWLQVEFNAPVEVSKVIINERTDVVTQYNIQYWNETSKCWINIVSGTTISADETHEFLAVSSKKFIMRILSATDRIGISEFKLFDTTGNNLIFPENISNANTCGGKAVYIPNATVAALKKALDSTDIVYDVNFDEMVNTTGGNLSYMHKVVNNRDIYFVANSSDNKINTTITLRGTLASPVIWNPHDGEKYKVGFEHTTKNGVAVTKVELMINAVQSIFIMDDN